MALQHIRSEGLRYLDVRKRTCIEVLNLAVQVEAPEDHITAPIEILQGIKEWSYPSLTEIAEVMLSKNKNYSYGYSYGTRIFDHEGIDQVNDYLIPLLKKDPMSRRAVLTLFDPHKDASPYASDVPGMVSIDLKIRKKCLHMTACIRSNDMFIGWPANIYQLFVLQEYIASRLECGQGPITTISMSAHIFKDHLPFIAQIIKG